MTPSSPTPSSPSPSSVNPSPITVPSIRGHKVREGNEPLVMVTAYDAPSARAVSEAGADMILVGDSVAMVVLGYDDTLQVTVDDMVHHTGAVARTSPAPLVVADLPWPSYHVSPADTVHAAARLIRAGAQAVKLEGGTKRLPMVRALVDAEIPVVGHLGLTPQSMHVMGGFKVQAKQLDAAHLLLADAEALVEEGAFCIVLEGIPDVVASAVTEAISAPTIGIGAGAGCDGQVLVFHDIVGFESRYMPKFVRRYADLHREATDAVRRFGADVRSGAFPSDGETYHASADVGRALGG